MVRRSAAAGALAFALAAHATVVCRWVDENGRTQVSDVVPAKYRNSASCTDSRPSEPSPEQRRQAQEQAAKEKAAAAGLRERREADSPPPAAPTAAASAQAAKRPAQGVTDSTDCATWHRLYEESVDCFAPYRTTRGATKAEAFERCTMIPSPELKCGPVRR